MFASPTAIWLDTSLAGFDRFFLSIQHFFGDKLGFLLTPLMRFITFMGEKGWVFFLLALLFILTADRRDLGVCIFGAVCCGALITNIILKDAVARVRPFEANAEFNAWWMAVGAPAEEGFSFPSGHVTACAAGMTAITCMRGKKWLVPSIVIVLLMGISRNYLMAHYPSDVLVSIFIGVFSGVVAWLITRLIFSFLEKNRGRSPICALLLDFDIRDVLPFQLPALPFGRSAAPAREGGSRSGAARGGRSEAAGSRRSTVTRGTRGTAEKAADADADMKTYAGSGRHAIKPEAAESATPAKAASPARGGRHIKAESAPEAAPAKARKSSRISVPGAYQGKH